MLKAVYLVPKSSKLFVLVWLVRFLEAFSKGKLCFVGGGVGGRQTMLPWLKTACEKIFLRKT